MRKLIILAGLLLAYGQANGLLESLKYPSSGLVSEQFVIVVETPEEPIEGTGTATETAEPVPEPEPVVEEVFEPLPWNGKVGKFVKKYGGKIIKIKDHRKWSSIKFYKIEYKSKGVLVGDDFYWQAKDGTLYVIHKGKLIKL